VNNQVNCIHEEIKSRLNSGNDCCHLVQNRLSSSLLSKNIKINIYRTVILLFVLYECRTSSLRLRKGCRSWVFDNRVLRKIFGPKGNNRKVAKTYPQSNCQKGIWHPFSFTVENVQ
jgi:hypothetical protein